MSPLNWRIVSSTVGHSCVETGFDVWSCWIQTPDKVSVQSVEYRRMIPLERDCDFVLFRIYILKRLTIFSPNGQSAKWSLRTTTCHHVDRQPCLKWKHHRLQKSPEGGGGPATSFGLGSTKIINCVIPKSFWGPLNCSVNGKWFQIVTCRSYHLGNEVTGNVTFSIADIARPGQQKWEGSYSGSAARLPIERHPSHLGLRTVSRSIRRQCYRWFQKCFQLRSRRFVCVCSVNFCILTHELKRTCDCQFSKAHLMTTDTCLHLRCWRVRCLLHHWSSSRAADRWESVPKNSANERSWGALLFRQVLALCEICMPSLSVEKAFFVKSRSWEPTVSSFASFRRMNHPKRHFTGTPIRNWHRQSESSFQTSFPRVTWYLGWQHHFRWRSATAKTKVVFLVSFFCKKRAWIVGHFMKFVQNCLCCIFHSKCPPPPFTPTVSTLLSDRFCWEIAWFQRVSILIFQMNWNPAWQQK